MALMLGVDTGGTYTDAVILDEATDKVLAKAKALTSRPDLSVGVGGAIDAAITQAGIATSDIAMVSLSTTLATNALVEGQGGRVALIFIGFAEAELQRAGLSEALGGDPVIHVTGGHNHAGGEDMPLDMVALRQGLDGLDAGVTGFAIASSFATRNPAHEVAARDYIRSQTGKPVTCSHELSQALGGPKRALTAVLNARLIGMIDGLISACEGHLAAIGVDARLMVVRGDGALVSSTVAREKPIETILSGPAASIAGASWLTGTQDALVSDIGGTTTDVCLLQAGKPKIDPQGARVGKYRTMVEAVAMRTTGLGGDSEVHIVDGLNGGLRLGPRRLMPISLAAKQFPDLVHGALDRALALDGPAMDGGQFVVPLWQTQPTEGLDKREAAVVARLENGPLRMGEAVTTRIEAPALGRLVARGIVIIAGVTPSDASHALGNVSAWDGDAATKALTLFARKRNGAGERIAPDADNLAARIVGQVTAQTVDCLLEAAFAEDSNAWGNIPSRDLALHPLTIGGLDQHQGVIRTQLSLGVPVIGLGASAHAYYGPVGSRLGTEMILPEHADVANAIGAVVGQVSMQETVTISSPSQGCFVAHLPDGPQTFADEDAAIATASDVLRALVQGKAEQAGVESPRISVENEIKKAQIEGSDMFIAATIRATAQGRPRIASG